MGAAAVSAGSRTWVVEDVGTPVTLVARDGVAATASTPPLDAADASMRAAIAAAASSASGAAPAAWVGSLQRAGAILDSDSTGEELSDVAWPHLLLPDAYTIRARRLAASAATAWQWDEVGAWSGDRADAANHPLRAAIEEAFLAVV